MINEHRFKIFKRLVDACAATLDEETLRRALWYGNTTYQVTRREHNTKVVNEEMADWRRERERKNKRIVKRRSRC